jgi:type II secretory pathway pseudopilin PulG
MLPLVMRIRGFAQAVARRLRRDDGVTLVELVVVLTILLTVLGALVTSFTTGMRQEVDQARRERAYANARLALQRMRVDIHCAGGLTSVDQNAYGGFTMTLTEAHEGQDGWCSAVIPSGDTSVGVQWCTVAYSGSTTRFTLYRYLGTDTSDCGSGTGSTFQVDYIAQPSSGWPTTTQVTTAPTSWVGNLWPTGTSCSGGTAPSGGLPTTAVDINIAMDPVKYPKEKYELKDSVALRNSARC